LIGQTSTNLLVIGAGLIGADLVRRMSAQGLDTRVTVASRSVGALTRRRIEESGAEVLVGPIATVAAHRTWDVIVDASDAQAHMVAASTYREAAPFVIDLTPSGHGAPTFPVLREDRPLQPGEFSMVSCGAQASVPILRRLAEHQTVVYAEVVTSGASSAAGKATRANLDEYILATQAALRTVCPAVTQAKVMVNLRPGKPEPPFRVTLYAESPEPWMASSRNVIDAAASDLTRIAGGYSVTHVRVDRNLIKVTVQVEATASWLPRHFGSVEIINANALDLINRIAIDAARSARTDGAEDAG